MSTLPGRPHVLVARLDNLGDVLLAGPVVRAVAASANVTLLAGHQGRDAAELLPGVSRLVTFDAPWVGYDPPPLHRAEVARLLRLLTALRLDAAVILTSDHQSPLPLALLARMAGVGQIAAISHDYPGSLLDVRCPYRPELHEVTQGLEIAAALGFDLPAGDDGRLAVQLPATARRMIAAAPSERLVVIHPAASVPARGLPFELAREAAAQLTERGWVVAVTGGRTAAEVDLVNRICAGLPETVRNLAGSLGFVALAALISRAAVVVAGNTGPAHLAAAVGTPVVSVFAPVVPAHRWRPWGVPSVVLGRQDVACAGCRARSCPRVAPSPGGETPLGQPCLIGVSPTQVVDAVDRLTSSDSVRLVAG